MSNIIESNIQHLFKEFYRELLTVFVSTHLMKAHPYVFLH